MGSHDLESGGLARFVVVASGTAGHCCLFGRWHLVRVSLLRCRRRLEADPGVMNGIFGERLFIFGHL